MTEPVGSERCSVLHVDLDAFFAAVEVLDDPRLAGLPVIVGGTGRRGVVAACTYEARAYGIHSAMPSVEARRRCPHAVFLPGRFARYSEMSERFHEILHRFTPIVEGISLDEAFLDVSGARRILGTPPVIAASIRAAVREELELDCSVGVARTKLLAKLASRAAKPIARLGGPEPGRAVVVVAPDHEIDFLHPMEVRELWGVGPATTRKLSELGVVTVGDLASMPVETLCRALGTAHGRHLAALAHGVDVRPVEASREAKSVGHEETFAADLHDHVVAHGHLVRMADAVAARLQEAHLRGRTVSIKVRFGDFTTISRAHTLAKAVDSPRAIAAVAGALLDGVDLSPGIRLLGVSTSQLAAAGSDAQQLSFSDASSFGAQDSPSPEEGDHGWEEVEAAVAAVRTRFGHGSVGSAALVGGSGLRVKGRGDTQWGPGESADGPTDGDGDRSPRGRGTKKSEPGR
jgi:DNA polymerase IV